MAKCKLPCEIYSRIVGYFRPVAQWNKGKLTEFRERKTFIIPDLTDKSETEEDKQKENNYDRKHK